MSTLGQMSMPADFPYREVFLRGRPRHPDSDPFLLRHPVMPCLRRAKIFAPFEALRGFHDLLSAAERVQAAETAGQEA